MNQVHTDREHRQILTGAIGLLLGLLGNVVHAQSLEQWTAWGDAAMERNEYYGASRYYDGALAIDGGRMSLQWKQAEACRLSNQYDKAAVFYDKVQRKDMGRTHPEALRWLGEMQLCMGDPDAAEKTWQRVLQKERRKDSFTAQRARNALLGCDIARQARSATPSFALEHLPGPVNTYDSEFGPRIGPDSVLHFTSLRGDLNKDGEVVDTAAYRSHIFSSVASGEQWTSPNALRTIGSLGNAANATWTLNGKWILFTWCPDGGPCRIHYSPFDGQDLIPTPLEGLGDAMSTQPMVVHWEEREMLLFVSDRPGGEGGMDIWQARLDNGRAVELQPMGPPVNSPGNERSPWYDVASSTLWFSSDFHPGMGGYDIFTSTFAADAFGTPEHAGVPMNSPANDLYPALYPERGEGWLTSNRIGSLAAKGETCCNDLYRWRMNNPDRPAAQASTQDTLSTEERAMEALQDVTRRFPLQLYFHNDDPDPRSWNTTTTQDYATTYRRYRSLIPVYEREGDADAIGPFFRDEVDRGYLELAELVITLREVLGTGTSVILNVRGHASPLARNDYNRNLSMRRIESLRNHLRLTINGELAPYLDHTAANGAQLNIAALPFGEDQARTGVSDDLRDLARSVYSVEASRERRIAIESLELHGDHVPEASEHQGKDLGVLKQDEERRVTFTVRNRGDRPLRILDTKADCGCTAAELATGEIPPGADVAVDVIFNGRAPTGPLRRTVVIRTDGVPSRIELTIEGLVVP